jgi:hypothetical protein
MLDDKGQQSPQRIFHDRAMEGAMPRAGPDRQDAIGHRQLLKLANAIDVNQMRRSRHAKRHRRYQTLTAGNEATVVGGELAEQPDGLLDCLRRMILERSWFHAVLDRHAPSQTTANSEDRSFNTIVICETPMPVESVLKR